MEPMNGIIHNGGIPNGPRKIRLPLIQTSGRVLIVDVGSRVSLTQRFYNPSDRPTSRAVYYFPVPALAAICSFELRTSGGKVLSGICKEKTQAREEHEQAVAKGEYTGLLELVSGIEIFTISIGSISAKETVYVKLVFVMNLMTDHDRDFLRFYLPVAVGQRYGTPPEALNDAAIPSAQTRLSVKIDVQTSGTIRSITSPTHTVKVEKYNTNLGRASRRRATVSYRSNTFLTEDFVLLLQADELDAPRCFAQIYRDPGKQNNDTLAIQLTIVPKFNMPPIRSQEYIFLVDRSGSMDGNRIETAKKTLTLLLRMLPKQGSYFNIFSFGSHADSLWTRSNVYDQYFLDVATQHVETMAANYGGTEILQGLDRVFRQRNTSLSTAVFVLTDGEAHNVDEVVALVRSAVQGSIASSPLRVYTLGIGSQVSSAMCEGIASAGNGACLFATRVEDITAKCARLLRAGRTPFVKDVHVEWGVPATVLASPTTTGASSYSPPNVQQAPTVIHDIHADVRLVIFAIFQLRKTFSPREVILRGKVDETGEAFHLVVPVRGSNFLTLTLSFLLFIHLPLHTSYASMKLALSPYHDPQMAMSTRLVSRQSYTSEPDTNSSVDTRPLSPLKRARRFRQASIATRLEVYFPL
ncbi:hypothetical protein BDZ89DRAFT_344400 [Hymenopellis radicata]|nr:hypothetical protein BDZ89DRAFT_344400 [Hymenopellis radicata]